MGSYKKVNKTKKIVPHKASAKTKTKARPSLMPPPPPTATNLVDTQPRCHVEVSASGYGIVKATKGPPLEKRHTCARPSKKLVIRRRKNFSRILIAMAWLL